MSAISLLPARDDDTNVPLLLRAILNKIVLYAMQEQ
jgi:hypothetical protein